MTEPTPGRKCKSWIDTFVEITSNTESPEICRRWTAIATIAAVLEQKVWIQTYAQLFPNLYTFIVAPPGVGKSQTIGFARQLMADIANQPPHIAPTSVNVATLVDQMAESKRSLIGPDMRAMEYNALTILVGEFGTFMAKFEDDMTAMLADFYDVTPYGQRRRGNGGLKIKIEKPLLNMLIGATPSVLMKFMPEGAWDQGLTSRIIFVYGDDRGFVDDFGTHERRDPSDLVHDLTIINNLIGKFAVTEEYANLVNLWRKGEEEPKPNHPRLTNYNTRRKTHLYRLSMIASIDRQGCINPGALILDRDCFNRAIGWMHEAEARMPTIFKTGSNVDTSAMDEIHYFVLQWNLTRKSTVPEHTLVREARKKVRAQDVMRTLDVMLQSGLLTIKNPEARQGQRQFIGIDPNLSNDAGQALLQ